MDPSQLQILSNSNFYKLQITDTKKKKNTAQKTGCRIKKTQHCTVYFLTCEISGTVS